MKKPYNHCYAGGAVVDRSLEIEPQLVIASEDSPRGALMTVLVTGAGAPTGQGVLQGLRGHQSPLRLIATDLSPLATGLFWADFSFVLPHCQQCELYLAAVRKLCADYQVEVLFPGSDLEARLLATNDDWWPGHHVHLACSSKDVWDITGDKLSTAGLANTLAVPTPKSLPCSKDAITLLAEEWGWPLVLKPRRSSGSRGICLLRSAADLPNFANPVDHIVQRYLEPANNEYTVGAYFGPPDAGAPPAVVLAMRRTLFHGNTASAELVSPDPFMPSITALGSSLRLRGYCNFQFITVSSTPYLIEINARFSSSVSAGLAVGCNFPSIYLRDFVFGEAPTPMHSEPGTVILRYFADYLVTRIDLGHVVTL